MQLLDVYTRLDQNTLLLVLLIISPVSLSAAPFTSEQTTIAQCQEIQCEPVTCASPVHLDGECCPICIAPGESLFTLQFNTPSPLIAHDCWLKYNNIIIAFEFKEYLIKLILVNF